MFDPILPQSRQLVVARMIAPCGHGCEPHADGVSGCVDNASDGAPECRPNVLAGYASGVQNYTWKIETASGTSAFTLRAVAGG